MRTSGLFTTHAYPIRCKSGEQFRLVFFGDVHRDSPNHAEEEWQDFLRYAKSLPESTRFVGMGDYLDSTSTSERGMLGSAANHLHETLLNDLEQLQAEKVKKLASELEFMRGRIVGLINGNHFFNFQDARKFRQQFVSGWNTRITDTCSHSPSGGTGPDMCRECGNDVGIGMGMFGHLCPACIENCAANYIKRP